MNPKEPGPGNETKMEISTRSDLTDLAEKAMQAAATSVIEISRRTGTPVIIWEDEQIKAVPVDEIERRTKRPNPSE